MFIPALLMGNAVVYKPSDLVVMIRGAIATFLHELGIFSSRMV
ncbi:hypothetical protein SPB21_10360 [Leptothoe sp. ISB3NOV94-8A]